MSAMRQKWEKEKSQWFKETSVPEESAKWAHLKESTNSNQNHFNKNENLDGSIPQKSSVNELQELREQVKQDLFIQENMIDNISLSPTGSYKLQVSIPVSINHLIKAWAAAEGRDLSSVALQCLEIGLRENKSRGAIPSAAIKSYEIACEKRIALAEINNKWERFEKSYIFDKTK